MIKITEDFETETDSNHGWQLHQYRIGQDRKTGEPKRMKSTTYHANFHQVLMVVIDRLAGNCADVLSVKTYLEGITSTWERKLKDQGILTRPEFPRVLDPETRVVHLGANNSEQKSALCGAEGHGLKLEPSKEICTCLRCQQIAEWCLDHRRPEFKGGWL